MNKINWKGPIVVGVLVTVVVTIINQGGREAVDAIDNNAWDDEIEAAIEPIKEVVTPMAKSYQSLAIDRKNAQITKKQEIYALTSESDATLRSMLASDVKELEEEVADLKKAQAMPLYREPEK